MRMPQEDWEWEEYFHWSEFDDPESDEENSGLNMQPDFMSKIMDLRVSCRSRIIVHGPQRGGFSCGGHAPNSAHYLGLAADIHFPDINYDSASNFIRKIGFQGVGFYEHWKPIPGFHIDMAVRRSRWCRTVNGLYVSLT